MPHLLQIKDLWIWCVNFSPQQKINSEIYLECVHSNFVGVWKSRDISILTIYKILKSNLKV